MNRTGLLFLLALVLLSSREWILAQEDEDPVAQLQRAALEANSKLREERMRTLVRELSSPDREARTRALAELVEMEPAPDQGVPLFTDALENSEPLVRQGAVRTLAKYVAKGAAPAESMKRAIRLILGLFDSAQEESFVREDCAAILGDIGRSDPAAVLPALRSVLEAGETPATIRRATCRAVAKIGPPARETMAALEALLDSREAWLAYEGWIALGRIEGADPSVPVQSLIEALDSEKPATRAAAFLALADGGKASAQAVGPLLAIATSDPREYVRALALDALGKIDLGNFEVANSLVAALSQPKSLAASVAVEAFRGLDNTHGDIATILASGLAASDPAIRLEVARALRRLEAEARSALPAVVVALQEATGETPYPVVAALLDILRKIGRPAEGTGPLLLELLSPDGSLMTGREESTRSYLEADLFTALAEVGVPEAPGFESIRAALQAEPMEPYRFAGAARAAASLGPKAAALAPDLARVLDPELVDRGLMHASLMRHHQTITSPKLEAIIALGAIGPSAKDAVPGLLLLLERYRTEELATSAPPAVQIDETTLALKRLGGE